VSAPFGVAICTLGRPEQLARTLDALAAQALTFPILVVDQSPLEDVSLARRVAAWPELAVRRDPGRGLSRARNLAWRHLSTEWIAFIDDDCLVEPGWAPALAEAIECHPEVALIGGQIDDGGASGEGYVPVAVSHVSEPRVLRGAAVRTTWGIGVGVSVVRRAVIVRLGGWDERLGAGRSRFPAAEDMDFNYRLLRAGETAYVTPKVRVVHEQWRDRKDLPEHYETYMIGWTGFALKQLRTGDLVGGLRLWLWGVYDTAMMAASAVRRRSLLRALIASRKLRGLALGTARGLRERW
jgi:GT2 family glycosyltransferase